MSPRRAPVKSKPVVLVRLNYQAACQAAGNIHRELKFGTVERAVEMLQQLRVRFVTAVVESPQRIPDKQLFELKRIATVIRDIALDVDGIDVTSVECPTCHAAKGWACEGRDYGYHAAGYHPARVRKAQRAKGTS